MNRTAAILLILFLGSLLGACASPSGTSTSETPTPGLSASPSPSPSTTPTRTPTPLPGDLTQTFILSMNDNGYSHLFAYAPSKLAPVRLTSGQWDDISPAVNLDGSKVVFASNRNAYWDLYILDLADGRISRLTDTPDYEGSPSWSPDNQWIIYETLAGDQMDIHLQSTTNPAQVIALTNDHAFDQGPVWSPLGRQVAIVSNRSGDNEIWVVDLDKGDESRYHNVSQAPYSSDIRPAWSPDGTRLAWASQQDGQPDSIYTWDSSQPNKPPVRAGSGDWPAWNASGSEIATRLAGPNQDYLMAYSLDGTLSLPPTPVGDIRGLAWHLERSTGLPNTFYKQAQITPTALWLRQAQLVTDIPGKRAALIKLADVDAPHPYLHDAVNESFQALRQRIIQDTGWDALASLENAYTPLTSSLDPGRGQDWLFTGRAFTLNPLTLNAGLMAVAREEIDGRTYWRIFLKTVAQDGSQGEPLSVLPWDLTARYNLDPSSYDQGGTYAKSIPPGYWVDLTAIARRYGWERIPALDNWRSYFIGTQFNEFVQTEGLDWHQAMLQLYPEDVFITPTVVIPPTRTPTATPKGYRYFTPTPTLTPTPTMRPTYTPAP